MAQREVLSALRVRETGRVEVEAQAMLPGPVKPSLKMPWLDFVAPDRLSGFKIDRMQVDPLRAGNERQGHLNIGAQFRDIPRAPRIVARGLDAARKAPVCAFKAEHIVALPALDRDR